MALIDDIIKWFKAPKTIKGIVGMIVIVIVLALDFAYWAGAIDVTTITTGSDGDEGEEVVEIPDDYETTFTGSLEHGRKTYVFQPGDDPRGEGEGETYNLYPVPIESNITEVMITSSGDGGRPRIDGGDSNDIDLYQYAPGKDAGGDFDSTDPDYEAATQYLAEVLPLSKVREFGNWTLRVDCYTGDNVQYSVSVQVIYARNETAEDNGSD